MSDPATATPIPASFEAGFAEVEITPPVRTSLAGFFHDRVGLSVLDPLHARAVVLKQGNLRIAMYLQGSCGDTWPQNSAPSRRMFGCCTGYAAGIMG